jgi:hypothetical protein
MQFSRADAVKHGRFWVLVIDFKFKAAAVLLSITTTRSTISTFFFHL